MIILTSTNLSIFSNHATYNYRICCGLVSKHRILWHRSTHRSIFSFHQNFTLPDYNTPSFDFGFLTDNLYFQSVRFPNILSLLWPHYDVMNRLFRNWRTKLKNENKQNSRMRKFISTFWWKRLFIWVQHWFQLAPHVWLLTLFSADSKPQLRTFRIQLPSGPISIKNVNYDYLPLSSVWEMSERSSESWKSTKDWQVPPFH